MRKNNKTETIFQNLFTDENNVGRIDKFQNTCQTQNEPYLQKYIELLDENKQLFLELADLEEIALQVKGWTQVKSDDLKITCNNDYVYVRTPFYRRNTTQNQIRVPMLRIETYNNMGIQNMEDLTNYDDFNQEALEKIQKAMEGVIHQNVKAYKQKFESIKTI